MKYSNRIQSIYIFSVILLFCIIITPLRAEEIDTEFLEGYSYLEQGEYEKSINAFKSILDKHKDYPEAIFFIGIAYNRMGKGVSAYSYLQKAVNLGYKNPRMEFELGWALLYRDKYKEALTHFEKFLKENPKDSQAIEFSGRCYYELGDLYKAEKCLKRAADLNPKLKHSTDLYLVLIEAKSNPEKKTINNYVSQLLNKSPNNTLAQTINNLAIEEQASDKDWKITLSLGGSYNSNIYAVGVGESLPDELSKKGGFSQDYALFLSYDLIKDKDDFLQLGYYLDVSIYEGGFQEANTHSHYFYANYNRTLNDNWTAGLLISDLYANVGNKSALNSITLRPSISYNNPYWLTSELAYTVSYNDFMYSLDTSKDNQDGFVHEISLTEYFFIPKTEITGLIGFSTGYNDAKGEFQEKYINSLNAGLNVPLFWGLESTLGYSLSYESYCHKVDRNKGGSEKRHDLIHTISAELKYPLPLDYDWMKSEMYLRYEFINSHSNIQEFYYRNHMVSLGITFTF